MLHSNISLLSEKEFLEFFYFERLHCCKIIRKVITFHFSFHYRLENGLRQTWNCVIRWKVISETLISIFFTSSSSSLIIIEPTAQNSIPYECEFIINDCELKHVCAARRKKKNPPLKMRKRERNEQKGEREKILRRRNEIARVEVEMWNWS